MTVIDKTNREPRATRLSKKEKQQPKTEIKKEKNNNLLTLKQIVPLTNNQTKTFKSFENNKHLFLHGYPGTGKTLISIYLALNEIFSNNEKFNKLIIVRSAEPSKSVGYLPGSLAEKTQEYETPYYSICNELFDKVDAYKLLKGRDIVEFMTTSYLRGITLDNCIIIVDEVQNLVANELIAIVTRLGVNSKIIFCGDYRQSDIQNNYKGDNKKDDILKFKEVIERMKYFDVIEFGVEDILRSELVKEFIIKAVELDFL